jgi:hypothetical protein
VSDEVFWLLVDIAIDDVSDRRLLGPFITREQAYECLRDSGLRLCRGMNGIDADVILIVGKYEQLHVSPSARLVFKESGT